MALYFSDEAIKEVFDFYNRLLDDVNGISKDFGNYLVEKSKQTHYEPIINISNEVMKFCNEDVKASLQKTVNDWIQSDSSFHRVMEQYKAGDDAIAKAKTEENKVSEIVSRWRVFEDNLLDGIDKSNLQLKDNVITEIAEECTKFTNNLSSLEDQYRNAINQKIEENRLYEFIQPVLLSSISTLKTSVNSVIKDSFDNLLMFMINANDISRSFAEEVSSYIAGGIESNLSDGVSILKEKVKKLLDD